MLLKYSYFWKFNDYKGDCIWIFSVKSFSYILNDTDLVTVHVLMSTVFSFAISSQGCLVKFDADSFDWFSCFNLQRPTSGTAGLDISEWLTVESVC